MSSNRFLAEYAVGGLVLAATATDASVSTDTLTRHLVAFRTAADASASSDSLIGRHAGARTAADTSISTESLLARGLNTIGDTSTSSDTLAARKTAATAVFDVSLSSDQVFGVLVGSLADTSVSTDTLARFAVTPRTATDISASTDTIGAARRVVSTSALDISLSSATLAAVRFTGTIDVSVSTDTLFGQPKATGVQIRVRERAPLRLAVAVKTPAGYQMRWGGDDPNPANVPGALAFSSAMPGGDEQFSCTLRRDPSRTYPDLEPVSMISVFGAGKEIAAQARLEQHPDVSGDQMAITPGGPGWQAHLDDDASAREIFADLNIGHWQAPSIGRQAEWLQQSAGPVMASGPTIGPDFSTSLPCLIEELQGSWTESQVIEAWYDAHGIPVGLVYAAWETNGMYSLTGGIAFGAAMFITADDTGQMPYDQLNPLLSTPGSATLAATADRPWALLQFWNDTVPGGKDGVNFDLDWTAIGVYGRHGLPLHGTADLTHAQGVLASDAIAYIIDKWCPRLSYSTGPNGTIQPSAFVIPSAAWLDPVKPSAMVQELARYELLDWAVEPDRATWNPTFYLNARGARGRQWRARSGRAQLQQAGLQVARLWNGVIVSWNDTSGVTRTVGPPGSGTNYTDATLLDVDPLNPLNQGPAPLKKYAPLAMGTSTLAGAAKVGQNFLAEQKLLDTSGQASHTGWVQDAATGIYWPAWMMRAGDRVSYSDAADSSYRRIVHAGYDDTTKTCAVQLDQPPDSLQALLERLGVVLAPYGMS